MKRLTLIPLTLALSAALSACGGGGGGSTPTTSSSSSTTPPPSSAQTVPGVQVTPTYAAGSVQLAMFNQINAYRQQCGFPPVQQDTLLDQAAQNHAQYMVLNGGQTTDTEVQGNPGFTGVTYQDRADALGWPSGVYASGGTGGYFNYTPNVSLTSVGTGEITAGWGNRVYHQALISAPYAYFGAAWADYTTSSGTVNKLIAQAIGGIVSLQNAPLTFPCQGTTGLAPNTPAGSETPFPPNTSPNGYGTPINVMGNVGDNVLVTSASMTGPNGIPVPIQILNADTDPNHALWTSEASVYPTSPLQPNTTYAVSINGTINGTPFSRNFSFTTGAVQ